MRACSGILCIAVRVHVTGSHIRLRLRVGALRQQRSNHLHVALSRSDEQRRRSVLPHKASATVTASLRHPPKNIQTAYTQAHRERRRQGPSPRPSCHAPPISPTAHLPACTTAATCSRCPSHPLSLARTRMRLGARASETFIQLGVPLCAAGAALCMAQPPYPTVPPNQSATRPRQRPRMSVYPHITYPSSSIRVVHAPAPTHVPAVYQGSRLLA